MRPPLRRVLALVTAGATAAAGLALGAGSTATASQPGTAGPAASLPATLPSTITPAVNDGQVEAIAQVGDLMVVGGTFTQVGGQPRAKIVAFKTSNGAISTTFAPDLNGDVLAVLPGSLPDTVYVGGRFTTANGTAANYLTLLRTTDGSVVTTFKPGVTGWVNDMSRVGNRLLLGGFFTKVGTAAHVGLGAVDATTGKVDPFVNVQLSGQHNDSGSGKIGTIGVWDMDVSADGSKLIAIGNFKRADGIVRDQAVMVDLTGSAAVVKADWATTRFAPYCYNWAFDNYMRGVSFSPDGSYFVINTTGGGNTGTLCDTVTRWESNASGTTLQPTWIQDSGGDTMWALTITNTAVYVGGHQRWLNNPLGIDQAKPGAVGRAGIAALEPLTGRPFSWNPGRKPLGLAVFAMLATPEGLWLGSDTDYIGNFQYARPKLAFFPYAGGTSVPANTVGSLPGTVFLPGDSGSGNTLRSVVYNGASAGAAQPVSTTNAPTDFSSWRGAFYVAGKVWYLNGSDGWMYSRTFDGNVWGPAVKVDPYHDAYWDTIRTGVGDTVFAGVVPSLYGTTNAGKVTAMTYWNGKVYYTLRSDSRLYSRWFNPESGILDERVTQVSSPFSFANTNGLIIDNGTLYFTYTSGSSTRMAKLGWVNGAATGTATYADTNATAWSSKGLFLLNVNQAPTAAISTSCTDLTCTVDGSGSTDADGTVAGWSWNFGDGSAAGSGASTTHRFDAAGTYPVTLTVTDDKGATASTTTSVSVTAPTSAVSFVGAGHSAGGNVKVFTAKVPAEVQDGDVAVLFLTKAPAAVLSGPTGVTGWTSRGVVTSGTLETTVWTRALTAADAGVDVRFDSTAFVRASVNLAVYRGVDPGNPVTAIASATDAASANHSSAAVAADSGDWVVSFWGSRASATRTWTAPATLTARDASTDSGNPSMQGLVADSGGPVSVGTVPGSVATTDATTDRGTSWSIALNAG